VRRLSIVFLFALVLSACSGSDGTPKPNGGEGLPDPEVTTLAAPDPDEVAVKFLDAWKEMNYASMYALLSPPTQDGVSEDAFAERYEYVRTTANITNVDYQIVSSLVISPQAAEVRYRLTLTSGVVGDVMREARMDLTREGEDWRIAWTEGMILPELEGGNRLRMTTLTSTRANIYDRNGLALASEAAADEPNVAALWMQPNLIGDEDSENAMLSALRRMFGLADSDPIYQRYAPVRYTDYFTMLGTVPYSTYENYGGLIAELDAVLVRFYGSRYYYGRGLTPFAGAAAPHAVGYVSQIQEDELAELRARGYAGDEFVGRTGIEAVYEDDLRGVPGGTLYLTDPEGNITEAIASRELQLPYAVYTTLDRDLQMAAQEAFVGKNYVGAIVVLERDTGAVLALASSPGFDTNLFDYENPNAVYGLPQLLESPSEPYTNRATNGLYPPGSTFKIVTMAAALESGEYNANTMYDCQLEFTELYDRTGNPADILADWRKEREWSPAGKITLVQGLEYSCNPYFYHIGLDLFDKGYTTAIPDMAAAFGLGKETGIEIGEAEGLVPNPEWKLAEMGVEWGMHDPVNLAIGQGSMVVTPLQMARMVAAVGNGGTLYRPSLVLRVENADGEVRYEFSPEVQGELPVSPENLATIQQAMTNVVRVSTATAYRKFLGLNINIAGKTGTASTGRAEESHAWFVGYTFEGREGLPDIAIVVVLDFAGEGSDEAAPVFRRIVETYFRGQPQSLYPWEARIGVPKTETPEPEEGEEATATPEPE
jgi:penicillin-binding protein 2